MLEELTLFAVKCGEDQDDFVRAFLEWRQAGPGQVLAFDDCVRYIRRILAQGDILPWNARQGTPWTTYRKISNTDAQSLPRLASARPGDYIVGRRGGFVHRIVSVDLDGTIHAEIVSLRKKTVTRPEEFRLVKKGE
jgi:hypothetical protein